MTHDDARHLDVSREVNTFRIELNIGLSIGSVRDQIICIQSSTPVETKVTFICFETYPIDRSIEEPDQNTINHHMHLI